MKASVISSAAGGEKLLEVEKLNVVYGHGKDAVHAVKGVSFNIQAGEIFGLVGESGCGKSSLGKAIVRLTEPTAGKILFKGTDVSLLKRKALQTYRREIPAKSIFISRGGDFNGA